MRDINIYITESLEVLIDTSNNYEGENDYCALKMTVSPAFTEYSKYIDFEYRDAAGATHKIRTPNLTQEDPLAFSYILPQNILFSKTLKTQFVFINGGTVIAKSKIIQLRVEQSINANVEIIRTSWDILTDHELRLDTLEASNGSTIDLSDYVQKEAGKGLATLPVLKMGFRESSPELLNTISDWNAIFGFSFLSMSTNGLTVSLFTNNLIDLGNFFELSHNILSIDTNAVSGIGSSCFAGCPNIQTLKFSDALVWLGTDPNQYTEELQPIENNAFDCGNLESLEVPSFFATCVLPPWWLEGSPSGPHPAITKALAANSVLAGNGVTWIYTLQNKLDGKVDKVAGQALYSDAEVDNRIFQANKENAGTAAGLISSLKDGVPTEGDTLQKIYNLILGWFTEIIQPTIAARDAYDVTHVPCNVFVEDDGDGKWALYKATSLGTNANYVKFSDPDLLNAVMSGSQIKTAYESNPDTNGLTNALKLAYDTAVTWITTNGANILAHLADAVKHITGAERTQWNAAQENSAITKAEIEAKLTGVITTHTHTGGGALGYFTEAKNTAAPNATIPIVSLTATGVEAALDVVIAPKATGSFSLRPSDGTAAGGNKRGNYAVDLQMIKNDSSKVASGQYSFVAGGQDNTASAAYCFATGQSNSATNSYAFAFGFANQATGPSSIAGGTYAKADKSNQFALGSQGSGTLGRSQYSTIGAFRQTVDATPLEGSSSWNVASNKVFAFTIKVACGTATAMANCASFERRGLIYNNGTLCAIEGAIQTIGTDIISAALAGVTIAVTANNSTKRLTVMVTGLAATTINWTTKVELIEVGI